jgi:CRISPR-associated protein Cmr4
MFQEKRALFLYCVSPVHMGAGTALGIIDNPIQRERHLGHPVMAGSGLKGALRHHLGRTWDKKVLCAVFGPETDDSSEHAGAVSFSDAQLLAFPVRSPKRAFVYAVSPTTLARAGRLLFTAGVDCGWSGHVPDVKARHCGIANPDLLTDDKVALESFQFTALVDQELRAVSEWLSEHAMHQGDAYQFFRNKLKEDLVLLSDEEFSYFVKNATVVEPHVRIDDITGTAQEGGLFYTENLPPESVMVSLVMASEDQSRNGEKLRDAATIMGTLVKGNGKQEGIHNLLLQIGGDASTGRGQVILTVIGGN